MKRIVREAVIIVGLAVLCGMGRNFIFKDPMPLFRYEKSPAKPVVYKASFESADAEFVRQFAKLQTTVLVDARPAAAFAVSRIPSAINIPVLSFDKEYPMFVPWFAGKEMIIVYCQGSPCIDSRQVIEKLWDAGQRNLFLFCGGMPEWREKGYDVER